MKFFTAAAVLWCGVASAVMSTAAFAVPVQVDLSKFTAFGSAITVASDGSSALLSEDPAQFAVFLFNDPSMGGPDLITPSSDTFLLFDYGFDEASGNDDIFQAYLYEVGNYPSLPTFEVTTSNYGTVALELTDYLGKTLGLDFVLVSNDFDLGSSVTVSNVRLEQRSPTPVQVPEPWVDHLFGLGLVLMWWLSYVNKGRLTNRYLSYRNSANYVAEAT